MEAAGAQHVALMLGDELRSRGHAVETWFLYLKRPAFAERAHVRVLHRARPHAWSVARLVLRLVDELRAARPDAVITHTHYANVIAQVAAAVAGVPTRIAVQHNPTAFYPRAARLLDRLAGSSGIYTANVAVSQAVVDSMTRYSARYRRSLHRILNGVSIPADLPSRAAVRALLGIPQGAPLIVNVGRLAPQKNQALLIDVAAELPEARIVIVGAGELRSELAERARQMGVDERVHFTGELSREEGLAVVAAADVFAFPSRFEAMPLALTEAMLLGIPVVASDIAANRELIGDAGVLVRADDARALVAGIGTILDDPSDALRLSEAARKRASAHTVSAMADQYELLLQGCGS